MAMLRLKDQWESHSYYGVNVFNFAEYQALEVN